KRRPATPAFGTPAPVVPAVTAVDRPPTAAKAGPRPRTPRDRKPMFIALAAIVVALAAVAGAGISLSQQDTPKPDPIVTAHNDYVAGVDKVMTPLKQRIDELRPRIAAATTPGDQQAAADAVAQDYGTSLSKLRALKPPQADAA